MKILIVDDDRTLLAMLRDMLVELGHTVVQAHDGFQAVAAFARDPADVVFVDYLMPRLSGLEVLKTVKQQAPDTFVVLITRMSPETLSRLRGIHRANAVVEKPIRKQQVERLLARAARKRPSA